MLSSNNQAVFQLIAVQIFKKKKKKKNSEKTHNFQLQSAVKYINFTMIISKKADHHIWQTEVSECLMFS